MVTGSEQVLNREQPWDGEEKKDRIKSNGKVQNNDNLPWVHTIHEVGGAGDQGTG